MVAGCLPGGHAGWLEGSRHKAFPTHAFALPLEIRSGAFCANEMYNQHYRRLSHLSSALCSQGSQKVFMNWEQSPRVLRSCSVGVAALYESDRR